MSTPTSFFGKLRESLHSWADARRLRHAAEANYWRERNDHLRYMASYRGGVSTRLTQSYSTSTSYVGGTTVGRQQLANARNRALKVYRDSPVGRSLIQTETSNVIGRGFTFQSRTGAKEFDAEQEERWWTWLNTQADIRGMRDAGELQRTVWESGRVCGDIGTILVDRGGNSRLQLIPADLIANKRGLTANGNKIDGVTIDALGRPRAFDVATKSESGADDWTTIPANNFVFLAFCDDPYQVRGQTCYLQIFDALNQFERYHESVSLAAWMATVFGLIFKEPNAAKSYNLLDATTNASGDSQKAITIENGQVKFLGKEGEVVQVQAQQPMQQTPDFMRALLRIIGLPFDMPLELVLKDVSQVNFSSARVGLLGYYRACRARQEKFISHWLAPIHRWWISREKKRQELGLEDAFKSPFPENYWDHEFKGEGWPYTDPVSEAQAALLRFAAGLDNPYDEAARMGGDFEDNIARLGKAREAMEAVNLPFLVTTLAKELGAGAGPAVGEQPMPDQPDQNTQNKEQRP